MVIEHRKWVEGMEIGYWILDIGVGMGSNTCSEGCVDSLHADREVDSMLSNMSSLIISLNYKFHTLFY